MNTVINSERGNKLIKFGVVLFLLGLITGLFIPIMQNPRMGLSSHLEGTLNGMLLIIFGLIWPKINLTVKVERAGYFLALYGTFTNWFTTLLAASWGAGSEMMPIAGADMHGAVWQEIIIKFGLISLALSMLLVSVIILWGLRSKFSGST